MQDATKQLLRLANTKPRGSRSCSRAIWTGDGFAWATNGFCVVAVPENSLDMREVPPSLTTRHPSLSNGIVQCLGDIESDNAVDPKMLRPVLAVFDVFNEFPHIERKGVGYHLVSDHVEAVVAGVRVSHV